MTIPASVQFLFEAGIIAPEHLGAVEAAATRVDGLPELAQQLVELNLLTRFQARQVISGKQRGLLLGEYVLLEPIGRGGMGIVFRAVHRRMQRVVAVKQLAPELVKNEDLLKRFQREIQAAAKLVHPHIVTAYDANEDRGIHYYVMEYVPGEPLSEHVRRAGTMDVATAIDAIKEAALGLAYAHSQGVIHRDVKPSNLLLTQEGHVKVLDLGLARSIEERPQESDLTHTGTIMGTVDFMSPEQALNTKRADHRADIYSLGCTLFYLLTKREVYQGETMMERVVAHREAPIPSLRDFREDIPEEVDQFFQKMIAKSSEQRFQTMTEVVSACEKLFVAETDTTLDFTFHEPQKPLEATLCKTRIDPAQIPRRSKTYGGRIIASSCLCLCLVLTIWGSMSPRNESENDAVSEAALTVPSAPADSREELSTAIEETRMAQGATVANLNHYLVCNGVSSYVRVPSLSLEDNRPLTIECWVNIAPEATSESQHPITWMGSDSASLYFLGDRWGVAKRLSAGTSADSLLLHANSGTERGVWTHVAGTWDGTRAVLYVGGERVAANTFDYAIPPSQGGLYLGGFPPEAQANERRFVNGGVDEVRISAGIVYTASFTPLAELEVLDSTIAMYHCNTLTPSGWLEDTSGNGHHGELVDVVLAPRVASASRLGLQDQDRSHQ